MDEQNKQLEKSEVALREERVLEFWREQKIFEKTLEKEAPNGDYVFYDGPPFATGLPHYGHILASSIKDAIPRYQTMRGFRVPRRWGWDCHGLPIENIVEKDLGISGKKQIEEIGVEKFNEHARSKVLIYVGEWKKTIERIGRFVDFDGSYKTMDNSFIESVWWALSELNSRNLVYEGVRVLPYCPRCETPIANSEIAMDNSYKDITDISVYVKLALHAEEKTYLIAWTTTPWTLPGNTAAAVNPEITYIKVAHDTPTGREFAIIAKDRFEALKDKFTNSEIINEFPGSNLIGKRYEPIFPYFANTDIPNVENGWRVYGASYVTTDTGTGIVHLAPAYGEEDMELALKENIPFIRHVGPDGKFTSAVTDFAGLTAKPKGLEKDGHQVSDIEIIKYLAPRGILFAKEKIVHSYPHCFRCETPLFYFAIPAWFLKVSEIKKELISKNEEMTWIPEHLKHGRFEKSMEGAPDWNISRNRYWASPLPIWKCESCNKKEFISSIENLKSHTKRSGNTYSVMRHGEAESNVGELVASALSVVDPLTTLGKEQVSQTARALKEQGVDIIIASPILRTKMTAEILKTELGLSDEQVIFDARIREIEAGIFEGKNWREYHEYVYGVDKQKWFSEQIPGGESFENVRARVGELLYELETKYSNKKILFVTHGGPAWLLFVAAGQFLPNGRAYHCFEQDSTCVFVPEFKRFSNAEVRALPFVSLPHNKTYGIDLHRPYIDSVELLCECGNTMRRIPEVIDCWFESGSMPFAQDHYPFERENWKKENFPADFVAEYIAQTRTWFYYTHLLSTTLFGHAPFKHVVTTGTVLAEDGQKMSKSKNNFPDPWLVFNKYGVDALRLYLLGNPIMRGEDMNFSERELADVYRKVIARFDNVREFYELYRDEKLEAKSSQLEATNVLDGWILARLRQVINEVTQGMEKYELDAALRPLAPFVDDLSTWYLRRSRDRIKDGDVGAKQTLYTVLKTFAHILAPFAPFAAEQTYQVLGSEGGPLSVHLSSWPESSSPEELLSDRSEIENMERVRALVTLGLEARQKANIKVRQPLRELKASSLKLQASYTELIEEELNVKSVVFDETVTEGTVVLDTLITPELKEEGMVRELVRAVQDARKSAGLSPADAIELTLHSNDDGKKFVWTHEQKIKDSVGAQMVTFTELTGESVSIDTLSFIVTVKKVS